MKRGQSRRKHHKPKLGLVLPLIALAWLLTAPTPAEAYAGPGAGFAVHSSFWPLFIAFVCSLYAFFMWPFNYLVRSLRRGKALGKALTKRAVVVGFDRMNPD